MQINLGIQGTNNDYNGSFWITETTIMQIRANFLSQLKYQRFAASSWQDHKHILTFEEIPEQVSILKSPKIQNLLCIVLCKPLNAPSNSQPSTTSFIFVTLLVFKTSFVANGVHCTIAIQPVKLSVRLLLLVKDWH